MIRTMKKIILILAAVIISAASMSAQDMAKATETYNNGATALQTGDKASALNYFQQALKMGLACGTDGAELVANCKKNIPGVVLSIGKELYNNKDLDGALAKFQEASKLAKDYGVSDVSDEAAGLISNVNSLKDMEAGKTAMAARNYTAAAASYKKVIEADSTNAAAALYLGQALGATGDIDGAVAAYKHAAANGQEKIANSQISNLYLKASVGSLKTGKYAEAIAYAQKSNEVSEDAQSYLVIGQASQKLGKNEDAIAAFEKYLSVAPAAKNASAITFTVAVLYQQAGNKAKALEYYEKIASDPKFGAQAAAQITALKK